MLASVMLYSESISICCPGCQWRRRGCPWQGTMKGSPPQSRTQSTDSLVTSIAIDQSRGFTGADGHLITGLKAERGSF